MFALRLLGCASERCRANAWSDAQENFFHTDADPTPKKEDYDCGKKEVTDAHTDAVGHGFAKEGKGFISRGNAIADGLAKKEESFPVTGRGNAVARPKEEESFAIAKSNLVATSKEKSVADSAAI